MEPPKVAGVTGFQDHQYLVRVTAKVIPSVDSKPIERQKRKILRQVFEREGIEPPTPFGLLPVPGWRAEREESGAPPKPPSSLTEE